MAELSIDSVKVDRLVKEFLAAQTLTILPQNSFGDAVSQFVDKDDKHAMEQFVVHSLENQLKHLMDANEVDEAEIANEMFQYRTQLEDLFASGQLKRMRKTKIKTRPKIWNSDEDGPWAEQPATLIRSDNEGENDDNGSLASISTKRPVARGRGKAAGITRPPAATTKKTATAAKGRGKKKVIEEEDDEIDDDDVIMVDDDDDDDDDDEEEEEESAEEHFVQPAKKASARRTVTKAPARAKSPAKKIATARAKVSATSKQSTLNFSQTATQRNQPVRAAPSRGKKVHEPVSSAMFSIMKTLANDQWRVTMRFPMMRMRSIRRLLLEIPVEDSLTLLHQPVLERQSIARIK